MMDTRFRIAAVCSLGLSMLFCLPVHSAPVGARQGDVRVLHGGIGAEDRAAMQSQAADYNLQLTFAVKGSGAYLSDVKVVIRDARGNAVLDTVASGPWLFARLPQGEFTVAASVMDQTLTQRLSVPAAGRRDWVFRFDPPAGLQ